VIEFPRFDRLKLRVMSGTLAMFAAQLAELPLELRDSLGLPTPELATAWRVAAELLHGNSVDAPGQEAPRPKTMDAA
jgi:hypothetical protein